MDVFQIPVIVISNAFQQQSVMDIKLR